MYKASAGGGAAARSSHRHALVEAMTLFMAPRFSAARRWSAYHTTLAGVLMAWEDAATLGERFEVVRDFLARALPRRRKLGRTHQGLAKAILRHGHGLVEEVRDHLRRESLARCDAWRLRLGFEAVTIDGSRLDAPRTVDTESGLGTAGGAGTHPQMAATVARACTPPRAPKCLSPNDKAPGRETPVHGVGWHPASTTTCSPIAIGDTGICVRAWPVRADLRAVGVRR